MSHTLSTANNRKKHRSIYLFPIFTDHANCKSNEIVHTNKLANCSHCFIFIVFVCESMFGGCELCWINQRNEWKISLNDSNWSNWKFAQIPKITKQNSDFSIPNIVRITWKLYNENNVKTRSDVPWTHRMNNISFLQIDKYQFGFVEENKKHSQFFTRKYVPVN